jgi:acetylornithine/succinyldiaminopimelate/putrescine aminotransferase
MQQMEKLNAIRAYQQKNICYGISDEIITSFIEKDPSLREAIDSAHSIFFDLKKNLPHILELSETQQIELMQESYINFYPQECINPYVSLAAQGPWIVTTSGAIIHDSGGYGMLGLGHNPKQVLEEVADPKHVMANIMTPSLAQYHFSQALKKELGHRRDAKHPNELTKIFCLNSGSEAMTLCLRISDRLAKDQMQKNPSIKESKFIAIKQGFHGRTDLPSQISSSSIKTYQKYLASFKERDNLLLVEANNIEQLEQRAAQARRENIHIQAIVFEPVMGEGRPGLSITPEFYKSAWDISRKYKSLFIIDSIQAGLRAHGCLSITDYPGFETLPAPDCEAFSKAINAGQLPLSVVAVRKEIARYYETGLYGNTMTANPRALSLACKVLSNMNQQIRNNIKERGKDFIKQAHLLQKMFPDVITSIQGTGLLFSMELNPQLCTVVGKDGLEIRLRKNGIGVIHGGKNALRFTPPFTISSDEINLIFTVLKQTITKYIQNK